MDNIATSLPFFKSGRRILIRILRYLLMALLAMVLFGAILLLFGKNPLEAYRDIFRHALGSPYGFSEVLVAMTPMLFTALAVALPSRLILINGPIKENIFIMSQK